MEHTQPEPKWSYVSAITQGVSISSSGSASVSSRVSTYSASVTIESTVSLQRLTGSTYSDYDKWTGTGTNGYCSIGKTIAVPKGTYRTYTSAEVYNNGTLVETATAYSTPTVYG